MVSRFESTNKPRFYREIKIIFQLLHKSDWRIKEIALKPFEILRFDKVLGRRQRKLRLNEDLIRKRGEAKEELCIYAC